MHLCKALPPRCLSRITVGKKSSLKAEGHVHYRSHPPVLLAPQKFADDPPGDSRRHHCLLNMETVGLSQQSVTRSTAL